MAIRISDATRARITEVWPQILSRLADGEFIGPLLAQFGLKPDWLRAYRAENPVAYKEWAAAREESGDAFAERALEMALNPVQVIPQEDGKEPLVIKVDPAHARNAIDTLKWAARIRNPRAYSDKAQLDVNVRTVDLTRIIEEANARLAAGRAPRILEHEPARLALGHAATAAIEQKAAELLELL